MKRVRSISRRRFLQVLLGLGVFFSIAAGLSYKNRRALYRRYFQLRLDESSGFGTLTQGQFEIIKAVFDVISPKPSPSTEELLEFVNWRTSTAKGYYQEYKRAADLLESKSQARFGASFATLEKNSGEEILRAVLPRHTFLPLQEALPAHETEPGLVGKMRVAFELLFFRAEARFKYFIFWDLVRFYWLSSAGWASVGYQSYPGVPDPKRTYTVALSSTPGNPPWTTAN
jgi:hypothetical protein